MPTTAMPCQTTDIVKEWEAHGETIIRTISRPCIGGATEKKDQTEWSDLRPIDWLVCAHFGPRSVPLSHDLWNVASVVEEARPQHQGEARGGGQLAWLNLVFLIERQLFSQEQDLGTQFRP
jgi:hypothetical protein